MVTPSSSDFAALLEERADGAHVAPDAFPPELEAIMLMAEARRCHAAGHLAQAEKHYRATLVLQPTLALGFLRLAEVLLAQRRSREAIDIARQLTANDPTNAGAHYLTGLAHINLGEGGLALSAMRRAVILDPDLYAAHIHIAVILRKLGHVREALEHLHCAEALKPAAVSTYLERGLCLSHMNCHTDAAAAFATVARLQPLTINPAIHPIPDFSVLMIWAPGYANTPIDYLAENAGYEYRLLAVSSETVLDKHTPGIDADLVLNLVADEDQSDKVLHAIADFLDVLGRPVLNHPCKILATSRDAIAARLAHIESARIPRTIRFTKNDLLVAADSVDVHDLSYPLLIRAAGTHGGDAFEQIHSGREIRAFAEAHDSDHYYLTKYIDYRSADGYFRKYRLIFVDGDIFPYHLAIHDHWKIHHYRTCMKETPWMQEEERRFLDRPDTVLTTGHYATLLKIVDIVGLDLFGIDCSILPNGELLVFEVNACMLIEPDDSDYAYRIPSNTAVKQAFTRMLARAARRSSIPKVMP
jgi:tetratricopeptide (TPR) repeat protein